MIEEEKRLARERMVAGRPCENISQGEPGKSRAKAAKAKAQPRVTREDGKTAFGSGPASTDAGPQGHGERHAHAARVLAEQANRKRSEAAKSQPRSEDGLFEPVVGQSVLPPVKVEPGKEAKAAAAVARDGLRWWDRLFHHPIRSTSSGKRRPPGHLRPSWTTVSRPRPQGTA